MLKHSEHREFLCALCGKQFKRKDKLKEHVKRMHDPSREAKMANRAPRKNSGTKKFIPKVSLMQNNVLVKLTKKYDYQNEQKKDPKFHELYTVRLKN